MSTKEEMIKSFVKMSKITGSSINNVQGGGGNTSVKTGGDEMVIKASGWRLADLTESDGFSLVNYRLINDYMNSPDKDENEFIQKIKSFTIGENENRPSIETGFHALLGPAVIHSHSVYANLLTCSREGKDLSQKLFPGALWVDYATPGKDLTLSIKEAVNNDNPEIIFLQNHGVIISAQDCEAATNKHELINETIKTHFNISSSVDGQRTDFDLGFMKEHILFPDQVVYTMAGPEVLETTAARETLAAYQFILENIKLCGLTENFLDPKNASILLNMESEKYRQRILKK